MSRILERKSKLWFLTAAPPAGYVPGLGRGAVGFTTGADVGQARKRKPKPGFDGALRVGRGGGPG